MQVVHACAHGRRTVLVASVLMCTYSYHTQARWSAAAQGGACSCSQSSALNCGTCECTPPCPFACAQGAFRYWSLFIATMRREWFSIDKLRLDKFLMLIRKFVHAMFLHLRQHKWCVHAAMLHTLPTVLCVRSSTTQGANWIQASNSNAQIKQRVQNTLSCHDVCSSFASDAQHACT